MQVTVESQHMKNMISEFKDFVDKGDVFTIAVGLVMALYFKLIVDAILEGVILPIVAAIFGKPNFRDIGFGLGSAFISIGLVISAVISFLAVAFILFLLVQAYNKTQDPEVEKEPGPSETDLLAEIRDAIKANNG
jgi:large conductance mechanosensitive channel